MSIPDLQESSSISNQNGNPAVLSVKSKTKLSYILPVLALFSLLLLFIGLNMYFSKAQIQKLDTNKQSDLEQLKISLDYYYKNESIYPSELSMLVPVYIKQLPADPKIKEAFDYKLSDFGQNYQLCIDSTEASRECISSGNKSKAVPSKLPPMIDVSYAYTYLLSGVVFLDENKNGIYNSGEKGIPDMPITVLSSSSVGVICGGQTDPEGIFACDLTTPGTYLVSLQVPRNYKITTLNPEKVTFNSLPKHIFNVIHFGLESIATGAASKE